MENLLKNSNRENESWKFSDITQSNNLEKSLVKTLLNDPLVYVSPSSSSCL